MFSFIIWRTYQIYQSFFLKLILDLSINPFIIDYDISVMGHNFTESIVEHDLE